MHGVELVLISLLVAVALLASTAARSGSRIRSCSCSAGW